jgi:hypothetical protein
MKLALLYNLKFLEVYIGLVKMLFISRTLRRICLLEFIPAEGGAKFSKHFNGRGGGASYKSLGTVVLDGCAAV